MPLHFTLTDNQPKGDDLRNIYSSRYNLLLISVDSLGVSWWTGLTLIKLGVTECGLCFLWAYAYVPLSTE